MGPYTLTRCIFCTWSVFWAGWGFDGSAADVDCDSSLFPVVVLADEGPKEINDMATLFEPVVLCGSFTLGR